MARAQRHCTHEWCLLTHTRRKPIIEPRKIKPSTITRALPSSNRAVSYALNSYSSYPGMISALAFHLSKTSLHLFHRFRYWRSTVNGIGCLKTKRQPLEKMNLERQEYNICHGELYNAIKEAK